MKIKDKEKIDFDFIGGQGNLTLEEEIQLTNFFNRQKSDSNKITLSGQNKSSNLQGQKK